MPSTVLTGPEIAAALGTTPAPTATKLASGSWFTSTEQTGTGSPQAISHGLGATPSAWWIMYTDLSGLMGPPSCTRGAATDTTCTVTVSNAGKYVLIAVL